MKRNFLARLSSDRITIVILSGMVLVYSVFFSAYQIQRQHAYENSLDTLSIEQPLWNTLHGLFMRTSYYPVSGDTVANFTDRKTDTLFGDHVQPSLLVFLLPYAVLPHTETLLVIFCICIGLGAIPLYRITRRHLSSPWLALLFAAGYLLLPAVETNTGWDIHGANLLPPLLLAALDAAETGRLKTWWVLSLLAMGFREDFPLFIGWAMVWMVPRKIRKQALVMFALGLVFSLASFFVIIPHFGGKGTPYIVRFFPAGTPITIQGIWSVLSQGNYWRDSMIKIFIYNVRLGMPLLFLYFGSTSTLVAMAPLILANSMSWYSYYVTPDIFHYSSPLIAWALVGAVDGFNKITHFFTQRRPRLNWNGIFGVALATSVLTSQIMVGYTPLSRDFIWPGLTGREDIAQQLINKIPQDAAVSVEPHLVGHFSHFKTVYLFPDLRDAQWILLDIWYGSYPLYLPAEGTQTLWNNIRQDHSWETVAARDGLILLKKGNGPPQNITEAYQVTNPSEPIFEVSFGGDHGISLVNITIVYHSKFEATLCTDWLLTGPKMDVTPQIQFVSTPHILSEVPGDEFRLSPAIFTGAGKYRLCNRRMGTAYLMKQREVYLSLQSKDATTFMPVSIINPGNWETFMKVQNNVLVIDLAGFR
jgi:uncharacterized membrane protein